MTTDLEFKTGMSFSYGAPTGIGPGVVRLVCENPGPFTFKGTNTYFIGSTELAVIDPGPADQKHIDDILRVAGDRPISHIVITHTHRDHVDNAAALKQATGAITCGYRRTGAERGNIERSPSGTEFVDIDFNPDLELADGDEITGAVLRDGAGEMGGILRRAEQMHGLHQTVEAVQRHHHRRLGIAPGDDGVVGILGNAVKNLLEPVARVGEGNGLHRVYVSAGLYKYARQLRMGKGWFYVNPRRAELRQEVPPFRRLANWRIALRASALRRRDWVDE